LPIALSKLYLSINRPPFVSLRSKKSAAVCYFYCHANQSNNDSLPFFTGCNFGFTLVTDGGVGGAGGAGGSGGATYVRVCDSDGVGIARVLVVTFCVALFEAHLIFFFFIHTTLFWVQDWTGAAPVCTSIECPALPSPSDGTVTMAVAPGGGVVAGGVAIYACTDGGECGLCIHTKPNQTKP
jgi:hypothetical protein